MEVAEEVEIYLHREDDNYVENKVARVGVEFCFFSNQVCVVTLN